MYLNKQQITNTTLLTEAAMYNYVENGSVTYPEGFKAAGIFCGLKRKRKDLALITSDIPCPAAGVFTLNKVVAAPVVISREIINNGKPVKAILINSGNANACTGIGGHEDALYSQSHCAKKLGVKNSEVLISSTGIIGQRLKMDKFIEGINSIVPQLSQNGGDDAAEAIMTTDTRKKNFAMDVELSKGKVKVGAIAKGSGMIMPNMATMLGFITTDAGIEQSLLQKMLSESVNLSFNKISVDGETSTNDMVLMMANGKSNINIEDGSEDHKIFQEALNSLCIKMAKSIVADGEGATKLVTVKVTGADTQKDADLVGKTLVNSPLVKTAIHGEDANWGRILSSAGMSGANINPAKTSVNICNLPVLQPEFNIVIDEEKVEKILKEKEIEIHINLNGGNEKSTWWTCDFSEDYIKINSYYRT